MNGKCFPCNDHNITAFAIPILTQDIACSKKPIGSKKKKNDNLSKLLIYREFVFRFSML